MAVNIAIYLLVTLPLSGVRPDPADPWLYEYLVTFGGGSVSAYDLLVYRFGFRPADPSLLGLFSAMFMHAGLLHLGGNMLFLWIFGDNVEHRLGPWRFLLAYLATGVAATLTFALFALDSPYPMIGASGAISGVLGSYFIWFPRNQVKTFIFLFPIIMQTIMVPARWVLGFYLVVDNLLPFLVNGGSATWVAYGAHIGGFIAGLALAWGLDRQPHRKLRGQADGKVRSATPTNDETSGEADSFVQCLRRGETVKALAQYARLNKAQRLRLPAASLLQLGQGLLERGDTFAALSLFRRFIAERPADPDIDRAYLGAGQALLHQPRGTTSAYHYFLSALDSARHPEVAEQARLYIEQITQQKG